MNKTDWKGVHNGKCKGSIAESRKQRDSHAKRKAKISQQKLNELNGRNT